MKNIGHYILNGLVLVAILYIATRVFDPPTSLSIATLSNLGNSGGFPGKWRCDRVGTLVISSDLTLEGVGKLTLEKENQASIDLSEGFRGVESKKLTLIGNGQFLLVQLGSVEDHCQR